MYTVSKGPSKIVAKTRRGISQNLDRLDTLRDLTRKSEPAEEDFHDDEISRLAPKPLFNVNGKNKLETKRHRIQEARTPEHDELIRFVSASWAEVDAIKEVSEKTLDQGTLYYTGGEANDVLQDFKPFDLESWWGKRLFNNITKTL